MNNFEKTYESILTEYNQIDESVGKAVKNFFKHPTGKGQGDEVVKTFSLFTKEYHFKQSNKHKDLYVKKINQFEVGLKLTFKDGTKDSVGTVFITVVDKKKRKYLAQDQQIQIKHSFTLEEFANEIQKFLTGLNNKLVLSRTDMGVDDEDEENNEDKKDFKSKDSKSDRSKDEQRIIDILTNHGVSKDNVEDYLKVFVDLWGKMDDNQKEVIRKLIGVK